MINLRSLPGMGALSPALVRYLAAVALVGFAVDGGIYAVLLNLYLVRLGFGPEQVGLVNATGTLVFALASLPAGVLGEHWGSRRALLLGLGLMAAGGLLLPGADLLLPMAQLPWLLVQIVVIYLGTSLFFVNTAPFVLEHVAGERRTQLLSLQTALLSLAAFGGSLLGGAVPPLAAALSGTSLAEPGPYRYGLLVAGLGLLGAIAVLRTNVPSGRVEAPPVATLPPATASRAAPILMLLVLIALVRMLQVAGIAATTTFFNVYLDTDLHLPTTQIGIIIAVGRLLGVPAALATPALTQRFGKLHVVIGASLASTLALLPLALVAHWTAASLSFVAVVGLSWVRYAASLVYFLELVPPNRRALVSGLTEMAAGICFTALAFGGGYIAAFFGYRTLFLIGALVTALSALIFWLAFRGRRPFEEVEAIGNRQ